MGFPRPDQAAMRNEENEIWNSKDAATHEKKRYPLDKNEQEILKRAKKMEKSRPVLGDFVNDQNKNEIARNQAWLEKTKKNFQEKTDRATILEYAILDQAERSNWLGENCYTIETTEYDDTANQVDFVVEWEEDGEIVRLAVDVTTSESADVLWKKESMIQEGIESGKMAQVKYFQSEIDPDTKGTISGIPHVVIAMNKEGIQSLAKDLVTKKPIELAKSPEQLLILKEISVQMTDQIEMALDLLLKESSHVLGQIQGEERQELYEVLREASSLAKNPENLPKVLDTLESKKKLLSQLRGFPSVPKYLNAIDRQRKILTITDRLIQEKSGSLDQEVVKQAAAKEKGNIVLSRTRSHLSLFHLPPRFQELIQAA